ncbi:MAG: superfamily I DNA/RNA helicase [Phycisphaerales bacterium]|jgi:superfamily I DNA/RNA helicase
MPTDPDTNEPESSGPPAPPSPGGFAPNDAQAQAARYENGPQIVLAGPGTGKTRVIVARVLDLLTRRCVEPETVLAVTFTNKAAGELRERLSNAADPDLVDRINTSTFHSYGLGLLQRFAPQAGLGPSVEIIDSSQKRLLLEELVGAHGLFGSIAALGLGSAIDEATKAMAAMHNAAVSPKKGEGFVQARLSELAGDGSPEAAAERARLEVFAEQVRLTGLFQAECARRGWLTFDDLIRLPTELILSTPMVAAIARSEARHLLVDEFQDVNAAQINLLRALAPPATNPDLTVVGDDDQAIYGFRGSDEHSFTHFANIWSSVRTIKLETNYRSTQPVLDVANEVIGRANSRFAQDKVIRRPEREDGPEGGATPPPVQVITLDQDKQSGEAIATAILRMRRGELGAEKGISLSDIAVICRTNSEAQSIRAELEVEGIPAYTARPPSPLDDPGTADLLAWIQLLVDPNDSAPAQRLLTRPPIGMDPADAMAMLKGYRAAQSRERYAEQDEPAVGTLAEYLRARVEAQADESPAVALFLNAVDDLAQSAAQDHADVTIVKIIRRSGVMAADLAGGEEHSRRVRSLAAVLRFARSRTPRLEQPRDLAAFWRYYQRLDEKEQQFETLAETAVNPEIEEPGKPGGDGEDGASGPQSVHVLTAHSSKGLEYDTVFVARVTSPHGYPMSDKSGDPPLPFGLGMNDDSPLSRVQQHDDEERRVFYVACTRAMRQLVLVGKTPASAKTRSFLNELINEPGRVVVQDVRDVLLHGIARDELETEALEFKERIALRAAIDRARTEARREAALALVQAERELGEQTTDQTREAFAHAADKLRCVAQTEAAGCVPEWAARDERLGSLVGSLGAALRGEPKGGALKPVPGPLRLSYTKIKLYKDCPRCYYVEHELGLKERPGVAQLVGTCVHEALHRFYTTWRDADSEGHPTPGLDELQATARELFLARWPRDQEVDHTQLVQIESQLNLLWERHHRDSLHITELERSVKLRWLLDGQTHTVEMKIDRVDLTDSGERIIDYKTGHPSKALTEVGKTDLQMGLYMLGLRQLRQDDEVAGVCEYWLLSSGQVGRIGFDEINEKKVKENVEKVICGILAGEFEKGKGCRGGCAFLDPA